MVIPYIICILYHDGYNVNIWILTWPSGGFDWFGHDETSFPPFRPPQHQYYWVLVRLEVLVVESRTFPSSGVSSVFWWRRMVLRRLGNKWLCQVLQSYYCMQHARTSFLGSNTISSKAFMLPTRGTPHAWPPCCLVLLWWKSSVTVQASISSAGQ